MADKAGDTRFSIIAAAVYSQTLMHEASVSSAEEDDRINRKSFAEEGFGRYGSVAQ